MPDKALAANHVTPYKQVMPQQEARHAVVHCILVLKHRMQCIIEDLPDKAPAATHVMSNMHMKAQQEV